VNNFTSVDFKYYVRDCNLSLLIFQTCLLTRLLLLLLLPLLLGLLLLVLLMPVWHLSVLVHIVDPVLSN